MEGEDEGGEGDAATDGAWPSEGGGEGQGGPVPRQPQAAQEGPPQRRRQTRVRRDSAVW